MQWPIPASFVNNYKIRHFFLHHSDQVLIHRIKHQEDIFRACNTLAIFCMYRVFSLGIHNEIIRNPVLKWIKSQCNISVLRTIFTFHTEWHQIEGQLGQCYIFILFIPAASIIPLIIEPPSNKAASNG